MIEVQAFLPGHDQPVDLRTYIGFVVDGGPQGDDAMSPGYLSYSDSECEIEAITD